MGLFDNLFGSNKTMEDKIFVLIDKYYAGFTRIIRSNINTDIEGKLLLLSVVFEHLQENQSTKTPIISNLMTKFEERLPASAIQTINQNGVGPVSKFIFERIIFYSTNFQYFIEGMGKILPMGICYCLYGNPLGKVEYVTFDDGKIGFTEEYSYINLPVTMQFIQSYLSIRTKFVQALHKII